MNCGTFHAIFISFVNVEIRHLQMAVIQIVHQEIGISSYLVALIIETTSHLYFSPFLSLSSNQSASASSKLHLN